MKKKVISIILKLLLVIAIVGVIAVATYFILKACGFSTAEDFKRLRDQIGDNFGFWCIIVLLQVIQVVFIPISNQIVTVPIAIVFNNELWKVFLSSWIGITIGTIILYFIGRCGGKKLLGWILSDKEQAERLTIKLKKTRSFYPIGMLIPFIPDDILSTLAGASKYNFVYVLCVAIITRGICCASSVWGFGYLTKFWWGWVILGVGIAILLVVTYILFKKTMKEDKK